jgi:hypothetical protein
MGVRILQDKDSDKCCLYCSTSGWAFGPIFYSGDEAVKFLDWFPGDPRSLSDQELINKVSEFKSQLLTCHRCGDLINKDEAKFGDTPNGPDDVNQDALCETCYDMVMEQSERYDLMEEDR